jgi:hypothetical protein
LTACAAGSVERKRLADGSWHVTCRLPMDECVRQFEQVCLEKRYRILSGQSKREVHDVEPSIREYRTTELTAICDRDAAESAAAAASASAPAPPPVSSAAVHEAPRCVPGTTQACVGPGGCTGGQACRADGMGFAACDCGLAKGSGSDAGS